MAYKYGINGTMLDYQGLIESLPIEWKRIEVNKKQPDPIIHPNVQYILSQKKGCKHIYQMLLHKSFYNDTNTWEIAWEREMGQLNWSEIYTLNKRTYELTFYQMFQYKILTRIVAINRLLHRMGIVDSFLCRRCNAEADTISHRFWSCQSIQLFWRNVKMYLLRINLIQNISPFNKKTVIFGCS